MKSLTRIVFSSFILFIFLPPIWVDAKDYYVTPSTSTVDGSYFCDGPCTSSDKIIIQGGERGSLKLKNLNGKGGYITVTNENTASNRRVVITQDKGNPIFIENCNWLDLRGNNDPDLKYGILAIDDGTPQATGVVMVSGPSNYIRVGFIEMSFDGNTLSGGSGIKVGYATESSSDVYNQLEFYSNYIHGSRYAGMYIGMAGDYYTADKPYVMNVSIHDNLLEDMGSYGITLKRVHADSGPCYILNNTIRASSSAAKTSTGLVNPTDAEFTTGEFKHGIGFQQFGGNVRCVVAGNYIEKTVGPGLKVASDSPNGGGYQIYGNTIVGCGVGDEERWGHGIYIGSSSGHEVYDNVIIQPTRYGIYAKSYVGTGGVTLSRNKISAPGIGFLFESQPGDLLESSGEDKNIYTNTLTNTNDTLTATKNVSIPKNLRIESTQSTP